MVRKYMKVWFRYEEGKKKKKKKTFTDPS